MKKLKKQHTFSVIINPIFFTLFLFHHSLSIDPNYLSCVPEDCGDGQNISYPFHINSLQDPLCGYPGFGLSCYNGSATIKISEKTFVIKHINYTNHIFRLQNIANQSCSVTKIKTMTLDPTRFTFVTKTKLLISICPSNDISSEFDKYKVPPCDQNTSTNTSEYVMLENDTNIINVTKGCNKEEMPVEMMGGGEVVDGQNYTKVVERGFEMGWLAANCDRCEKSGGKCGFNMTEFQFRCFCIDRPHRVSCKPEKNNRTLIIVAVVVGFALLMALAIGIFFIRRAYKRKAFAYFSSKDKSQELEDVSVYFGVSVFSYAELQDATNHFDSSKELGDGGFGTVYYGKLRDGREVAVKRLYEHNYKRVQQFMNEVEILTRLRHQNLVSLYGCTSRKSRELLLVYEYISNGTVADHLHGDMAKPSPLKWRTRMKIAIETANALVYLHASEIIHRDVKTTNILLDESFCVKVADFGLSRLLPNDVTHVSTAPQGTPGYVDPEYHQCYQLTEKSDVYSFGVVLIELISSMPAIDISRSREEISLANMAINRIQRCALDELIDPFLAVDPVTERMMTSVAELAFRCLQFDSESRPTMVEVLEVLKGIQVEESVDNINELTTTKSDVPPPSPENEGAGLLKGLHAASPISVTAKWHSTSSESTTPYNSVIH
uniref:LEAF RUST 10 DISEASE-RESISTANCE LOCUS RECEPTOR-LIKE PROTEIN KINASE-like 1.2 n=1 Tax=Erigeron canadensis TaxID=72917 RepID=UPI001CB88C68|nr:LEAF RUST 10 DISEASE-RESISTANCE LOCUS RECEPTOR-LIKE PROTEIN KINASE-like 1.2 [Erigeron canadensis]